VGTRRGEGLAVGRDGYAVDAVLVALEGGRSFGGGVAGTLEEQARQQRRRQRHSPHSRTLPFRKQCQSGGGRGAAGGEAWACTLDTPSPRPGRLSPHTH